MDICDVFPPPGTRRKYSQYACQWRVNSATKLTAPAPVARTLYSETAASQLRLKLAEERRAMPYVKTVHAA
jgi:hypothetical protein